MKILHVTFPLLFTLYACSQPAPTTPPAPAPPEKAVTNAVVPTSLPFWPSAPEIAIKPTTETRHLIQDLLSDDYQTQQRAIGKLAEQGPDAFPGLRGAILEISDPQLQQRVWAQVAIKTLPIPNFFHYHLRQILQRYDQVHMDNEGGLGELEGGYFSADDWDILFRYVELRERDPKFRAEIRALEVRFPVYRASLAIAEGNLDKAEKILRDALPVQYAGIQAAPAYAILIALRRGSAFDPNVALAQLRDLQIDEATSNYLRIFLFRAAGDYTAAARISPPFDDVCPYSLGACTALDAKDYKTFAERVAKYQHRNGFPEIVALRLAGQAAEADKLLAEKAALQPATGDADIYWLYTLLQNEHTDEAVALAESRGRKDIAFLILAYQLRLREALKIPLTNSDEPVRLLLQIGLKGLARDTLLKFPPVLRTEPKYAYHAVFQYAQLLREFDLVAQADRFENLGWEWTQKGVTVDDIVPIFPTYDEYAQVRCWMDIDREGTEQQKFNKARKIFNRQIRPTVTEQDLDTWIQRSLFPYQLQYAFNALIRVGEIDLAKKLVLVWCNKQKDPSGFAILGDWYLDHNDPKSAVGYYLKAAVVHRTDASLMYCTGLALSRLPDSKTAGEILMRHSEFLTIDKTYNPAGQRAAAMRRFDDPAKANAWYDHFSSHMGPPSWDYDQRLARARNQAESKRDYQNALALQTQSVLFPPNHPNYCLKAMASVALYHRLCALDALDRKDFLTLTDALDRNLNMGPPDVELLEKTLPALRQIDPKSAAKLLTRANDRLTPIVEDYPDATTYKSQLTRLQALSN